LLFGAVIKNGMRHFPISGLLMGKAANGSALSCVAQAADGRRGTHVQCQKANKVDWNALCDVSCSALLDGVFASSCPSGHGQTRC
jgi:hypothetical protein